MTETQTATQTRTRTATPGAAERGTPPALSLELEAVLRPEIERALPAGITVDRFMRIVTTAIAQNPDLAKADRRSLFNASVKCAQDGLVPDGREAALVIFNTKEKYTDGKTGRQAERWIKKVQYMPMVGGVIKKIRNSGELKDIMTSIVCAKDAFRYWIDDSGEHITHEPNILEKRGAIIAAYMIANTKEGGRYVEVMTRDQIEQVRAVSKAKDNGPWVDWFDEMARKTVLRRGSKRMPMSSDVERVIHRDDEFYDLNKGGRTAAARSGVDAARTLLGMAPVESDQEPEAGEDPGRAGAGEKEPEPYVPHYSAETAIEQIKKAKDRATLDQVWQLVQADFDKSKRALPTPVHGAYTDRLAAVEQGQQKLV